MFYSAIITQTQKSKSYKKEPGCEKQWSQDHERPETRHSTISTGKEWHKKEPSLVFLEHPVVTEYILSRASKSIAYNDGITSFPKQGRRWQPPTNSVARILMKSSFFKVPNHDELLAKWARRQTLIQRFNTAA